MSVIKSREKENRRATGEGRRRMGEGMDGCTNQAFHKLSISTLHHQLIHLVTNHVNTLDEQFDLFRGERSTIGRNPFFCTIV